MLTGAVLLALSSCSQHRSEEATPAPPSVEVDVTLPAPERPPAPPIAGVSHEDVATQPLPPRVRGVALFVHHVAYVLGSRLVLMDWRTGERRTVLTSKYGALVPLQQHGQASVRYLDVLDERPGQAGDDPTNPRRVLSVDLATGRSTPVERQYDQVVVGEFNDASYELMGGEVVAVWKQPDLDLPDQAVTQTGGRIVEAAVGGHQLVWTQSLNVSTPDPATVWTRDLFRPELAPTLLGADGVPYDPVVGDDFVGWSDNGLRVLLVPTNGGPTVQLPGKIAWGTWPAADRQLVAMAVRSRGEVSLRVFRVS